MAGRKLNLWIPRDSDYIELYSDEANVVSEPIFSVEDLREEIKIWEEEGFDMSEVKRELKDKKYVGLLASQFNVKKGRIAKKLREVV